MWRSRTRKYLFELLTFFVTSFPKNVTFWPRYKTFLNGKKCDDSAGTETCFSVPVSDLSLTPSTATKFRPKFFWKWSFFDQNQQPLKSVEPFERILWALFISQCPYKFSSFLHLRNASDRFRLFSRDFRLFLFFFPGSARFSSLASPRNLSSWVKYYGKFKFFEKEFRWTKFIVVERVI